MRPQLAAPVIALTEPAPFRWQDGERTIHFGAGIVSQAPALLDADYAVLTTPRAAESAPAVLDGARVVHEVPAGPVDELASELRGQVRAPLLLALGGGRVIDVAKALAAADPPCRVAAIPTTLSGAEMTAVHRQAAGVDPRTRGVRPAIVINDPELSASQPRPQLAGSAANALGHAVEGPLTPLRNPAAANMAAQGARLLLDGLDDTIDRERLALGSLLCGYAIGVSWYGLHHILAQTLVRLAGLSHGAANAIMLPYSIPALARRFPAEIDRLGRTLGADPVVVSRWLAEETGTTTLGAAGVSEETLAQCAEQAASRPELGLTPPPADRAELLDLYRAAL